jgi:glycosyltransferase involved in cell wall biosynthesis
MGGHPAGGADPFMPRRASNGDPLVSVIVPAHNRADQLPRALASVAAQTMPSFECLVVDDGSDDGTADVASRFRDMRFRVIRREVRGGGSAARNTGVKAAKGRWLAFLDSDDEWHPEKLHRQMMVAVQSPGRLGIVCTGFLVVKGRRQLRAVPGLMRGDAKHRLMNLAGGPVTCSVFMMPRAPWEAGVRFDESLPALQDLDLLYQLLLGGWTILGTPELLTRKYRDRNREHVFSPKAELAARRLLLDKYRNALAETPSAVPNHLVALALAHLRRSDLNAARQCLREAAAAADGPLSAATLSSMAGLPSAALRPVVRAKRALSGGIPTAQLRGRLSDGCRDLGRRAGVGRASAW